MTRDEIIRKVVKIEGGYVDDPDDRGGKTNFGITEKLARAHGYDGDMAELKPHEAVEIYRLEFWDRIKGDQLLEISPEVAHEVFDTTINTPFGTGAKILQGSLNLLNRRQELYPDVVVDGFIGAKTIFALCQYLSKREDYVLLKVLNGMQFAWYAYISDENEVNEKFFYGWVKNRVVL